MRHIVRASYARLLEEVRDALVQRMRAERAEISRRTYVADLFNQSCRGACPPE